MSRFLIVVFVFSHSLPILTITHAYNVLFFVSWSGPECGNDNEKSKPRKTEVTFPACNQVSVEALRCYLGVTKAYY